MKLSVLDARFRGLDIKFEYLRGKLLLPQKLTLQEVAVSQNVLYYQQLSIACYQVSFMLKIILSNYQ